MDGASQARGSQGIGVSRLARSSPSGKDLCVVFVGDDVKSVGGGDSHVHPARRKGAGKYGLTNYVIEYSATG